jgi:hypothetical protein
MFGLGGLVLEFVLRRDIAVALWRQSLGNHSAKYIGVKKVAERAAKLVGEALVVGLGRKLA